MSKSTGSSGAKAKTASKSEDTVAAPSPEVKDEIFVRSTAWLRRSLWTLQEAACVVTGADPEGPPWAVLDGTTYREITSDSEESREWAHGRARVAGKLSRAGYMGDDIDRDLQTGRIKSAGTLGGEPAFLPRDIISYLADRGLIFHEGFIRAQAAYEEAQATARGRSEILGPRERDSLLIIIAALCKELGIDIQTASAAATTISESTERLGIPLTGRGIENHLRAAKEMIKRRLES